MVVQESFVTRRPIAFLFIMLFVLFMIYLPIRYVMMPMMKGEEPPVTINDTYEDTWKWFAQDSPLTAEEKQRLFETKYKNSVVEWQGELLGCKDLDGIYSVRVKHRELEGYADSVFSTMENCTARQPGLMIRYRMKIIDLNVNLFVGKDGQIIA